MIAVMDSGVGGLRLLRVLRKKAPKADLIFLADQAHVPYGSLSSEQLRAILTQNLNWLERQGADQILIACNTASATGISESWQGKAEVQGIIGATCDAIPISARHILILSTPYTARQHSYLLQLRHKRPQAEVTEIGLDRLACMVEQLSPASDVLNYLKNEIGQCRGQFDLAVLACTHFPFVRKQVEAILQMPILDSESIPLPEENNGSGTLRIVTTGDPVQLRRQLRQLMDWDIMPEWISTEE